MTSNETQRLLRVIVSITNTFVLQRIEQLKKTNLWSALRRPKSLTAKKCWKSSNGKYIIALRFGENQSTRRVTRHCVE